MSGNSLKVDRLKEEIISKTDLLERDLGNLDLKLLITILRDRNELLRELAQKDIDIEEVTEIMKAVRKRDAVIQARLSIFRSRLKEEIQVSLQERDRCAKYLKNK
ncbi:MAG: hypothetical protein JXB45_09035 [Candidatus Krumholzibacteriota bacterium]|nr:hypothetical protein [Candidatus Krumholzibacteriota bacterium]